MKGTLKISNILKLSLKVKNFINANSTKEVIFTKGSTESLNTIVLVICLSI